MRTFVGRVRGRLTRGYHNVAYRIWRLAKGPGQVIPAPILLIGCDRSGTTIASQLFGQHPDVVNFSEARDVWDPRGARDPDADHEWTGARLNERDVDRIRSRFEFQRRIAGAKRLLNKHNRNSVRMDYLRHVFPDACVIHVIRDGRAVAHSITSRIESDRHRHGVPMGWFTKPPGWRDLLRDDPVEQAALQWRAIVTYILDHAGDFGERYIECRYEDLCARCRETMETLFKHCGLRADLQTLQKFPERLSTRNDKWRADLTPAQQNLVTDLQAPLLRRLGYDTAEARATS